jgi:hypothetical protein
MTKKYGYVLYFIVNKRFKNWCVFCSRVIANKYKEAIMKKILTLTAIMILSLGLMAQSGSGTCDGSGPNGSGTQGSGTQGSSPGNGTGTGTGNGNGSGTTYDVTLEETISGEITTVIFASCDGSAASGYQIVIAVDDEEVFLVMAPTSFLLLQELSFSTGDLLTVTGVFTTNPNGTEVFVVRTLIFESGEEVSFRDENGMPLWKNLGRN